MIVRTLIRESWEGGCSVLPQFTTEFICPYPEIFLMTASKLLPRHVCDAKPLICDD